MPKSEIGLEHKGLHQGFQKTEVPKIKRRVAFNGLGLLWIEPLGRFSKELISNSKARYTHQSNLNGWVRLGVNTTHVHPLVGWGRGGGEREACRLPALAAARRLGALLNASQYAV